MLASTILYVFVFLIFLVMFIEYVNDKRYQAKRREERQKTTPKKPTEPIKEISEEEQTLQEEAEPEVEEPEKIEEIQPEAIEEVQAEEEPEAEVEPAKVEKPQPEAVEEEPEEIIEDVQPQIVEEEVTETKELPECKYPPFTHVRLVEMGLSDDEATEFVNELIPQLEEQIPLIEDAMNSADFNKIERLTHGIKGSATNLGTGGVSDLLVEFNTYVKSGTDTDIAKAYHAHFLHYIKELKKQYT